MLAIGPTLAISSFVGAACALLAVLALTLPSYPGTRQARSLVLAIAASLFWAVTLAAGLYLQGAFSAWMLLVDAVHAYAWIAFVAWFLRVHGPAGRMSLMLVLASLVPGALLVVSAAYQGFVGAVDGSLIAVSMLGVPLIGLLGIEQLYRNAVFDQRAALRPLCAGIGIIFAIDVFVFAQALLFDGKLNEALWTLRGFANVAVAPLLLLAVKRQSGWGQNVFVSRQVVFYTATLVSTGLYLLAMAAGGYLIAATGVVWGPLLQLLFFACAGAALLYALFSPTLRRRLKVFIAKHFYRNRYDYREEWLRLTRALADNSEAGSLPERSVRALAGIIDAEHGRLWLADQSGASFEPCARWGRAEPGPRLSGDDELVRFMAQTEWVVDTREYLLDPEKYSNAFPADSPHLEAPTIFVPLIYAARLIGVVGLGRPSGMGQLSYEDHDLLKTAGRQVAIFLQQERAQEQLSETRQFEAFSRTTAFLMHDLKNLIAQQELVVGNAQRFKHRPEFIEDAVMTIEAGVKRMRRVLERLEGAARHERPSVVDLASALQEVCKNCGDRKPVPALQVTSGSTRVAADRDRLLMAVTHAIRNAQDATPADGTIDVRLAASGGVVRIEVADTGTGMDAEFVRNELFKPFHSTKGAKGMGIGAYQIRETMRGAGGDVEVRSAPGVGTTLVMWMPEDSTRPAIAGQSAA